MPWTFDCLVFRLLNSSQIMASPRTGVENLQPSQVNSGYPAWYGSRPASSLIVWFDPLSCTTGWQQFIQQDHALCRIDCIQLGHKLCKAILNESLGSLQWRHLFPLSSAGWQQPGSFSNMFYHSHRYYVVHIKKLQFSFKNSGQIGLDYKNINPLNLEGKAKNNPATILQLMKL